MKNWFAVALVLAALTAFGAETGNKAATAKKRVRTVEDWHKAHKDGSYTEMWFLVQSGKDVQTARAELGDAALFRRYTELLTRNFSKYSPGVVYTALLHMEKLLPAVDPVRAMVDLTYINSRIKLVEEKEPERWKDTRARMDRMLKSLEK